MGVKILDDISTALTTDTTRAPSRGVGGAADALLIYADLTLGAGSGWQVRAEWVTSGGTAILVGTTTSFTTSAAQEIPIQAPFENSNAQEVVPFPNQLVYTLQTSGTTDTVSGQVYIITPD